MGPLPLAFSAISLLALAATSYQPPKLNLRLPPHRTHRSGLTGLLLFLERFVVFVDFLLLFLGRF